jgi:hypothetical protein
VSEQIADNVVTGPLGKFRVSTIKTIAGGAPRSYAGPSPFTEADFLNETPWSFETMIFRDGSGRGLYHAPYATKEEAIAGHALMVKTIEVGAEFGGGVEGPFGTPSTTPEQWHERMCAK